MLARQRVVGTELREDRDHHSADQVPPLLILLGHEHSLKSFEGLAGLAAVPGVEGGLELVGARTVPSEGELRASGQSIGDEVVGEGPQDVARLLGVAATEQLPPETDRGLGMTRVQLESLP